MSRVWFNNVNKSDAKSIAKWWNGQPHLRAYFEVRRDPSHNHRWAVFRVDN